MNRIAIWLSALLLFTAPLRAQELNCSSTRFGDFVRNDPSDSIYVFRGLSSWYEMHTMQGFRRIYSIVWNDACHFTRVFSSSSRPGEEKAPDGIDSMRYTVLRVDADGATFDVDAAGHHYQERLSGQPGLDVWAVMTSRDNELKKDSTQKPTEEELKQLPDTLRAMLTALMDIDGGMIPDSADIIQLDSVISFLKSGRLQQVAALASNEFNSIITSELLSEYNEFIKRAYGKLVSYSVVNEPMNLRTGARSVQPVSYVFDTQFTKVKGNVLLSLVLARTPGHKLQMVNVRADEHADVPFISSLTNPFWVSFRSGGYRAIYDQLLQETRSTITFEKIEGLLSAIKKFGGLDQYQLAMQQFAAEAGRPYIVLVYHNTLPGNDARLTLSYAPVRDGYELAGIHFHHK